MKNLLLAAAATLALAMPSGAVAQETPVTAAFQGGGLRWNAAATTHVRWTPTILNGEIYICGAYSTRGASRFRNFGNEMMRRSKIRIGNQVLLNNTSFFNSVQSRYIDNNLIGQSAGCSGTGRPGSQADLATISIDLFTGPFR